MGWNHPNEESRADHYRDERKHDWRPGDPVAQLAHRLDAPLTTAMDIVVLVKAMKNYTDAAKLVDQYAGMVAAAARVDEAQKRVEAANAQA